jgi:hypothetical protein
MIRHQYDFVRVEDPVHAQTVKLADGDGRSNIVGQHDIGSHIEEIARAYYLFTAMGCQYLLC